MILTAHAKQRIAERFAGEDIQHLWCNARRIGKGKLFKKIQSLCPRAAERYRRRQPVGRYILMTPCNTVFVVQPPETVITVFRLAEQ